LSFQKDTYDAIAHEIAPYGATLVAVSKTKPIQDILDAYQQGVREFGENYVQELVDKHASLPQDIRWHFIGHLQTNKVKYIAPFVHLIHGVDSEKLLLAIDKEGKKQNRIIQCLLQVHIAQEESKFGFDAQTLLEMISKYHSANLSEETALKNVKIIGLMGMASFTNNEAIIDTEFKTLKSIFDTAQTYRSTFCAIDILSMGMSGDYPIALANGSNLIRIGSLLFGERTQASS
jgi:hypothetical protein